MGSMFDDLAKTTKTQLTKMRWALGLSGLLSVAVGVMIIVWPSISLGALTIVFGAYAMAIGIIRLVAGLSSGGASGRGWLIVSGLLGIAVGVVCFAWTGISALALLYVIGAYAIAFGIMTIAGAFYLPVDGGDTALMIFSGLVSIAFGIVMFAKPGDGALVTLALIAAFAIVAGISELVIAIGGQRMLDSGLKRTFGPKPQPTST